MIPKPPHLQNVGQTYRGFKLLKVVEIAELQCVLRELIHEPTGAYVMHIANDDPENVFCLSFQTLPYSSNGVAHILEHTVLCGSKKYPIKDPFFAMTRRSLNTFMNALTGADFTCYPAASQIPADFYNLLEVYLDAVFHPNLDELSFLQEGCRLEFSNPKDPSSPLEYKGIVYNEMKGALSGGSSRILEAFNEALFPNITYGVNSGGDPKVIPTLTYEQLQDFHNVYYHPSRCLFFFYGNIPLEEHLNFIETHALKETRRVPPLPPIPPQPRFKEPHYKELKYPIAAEEESTNKTMMAFGWLTCHILEQEEVLALTLLEIILMDTDASPLKMALLKSGLCQQAIPIIDIELSEVSWGIMLRGTDPENADTLEELIRNTLKEISLKGIPLQLIENAIHQLEFARSEITGDHVPFGLSLFLRSGLLKQHGAEPEKGLMIHSLFDKLRQDTVSDPRYLSNLIDKHFINNPHFVRIVMIPDKNLGAKEEEEEKKALELIKASLSAEQAKHIVDQAKELKDFQKKQELEDIEILPKISIHEVPLSSRDYPLTKEKVGKLEVFHHASFTNEIVYADLVFEMPDLPEEDLPYLRLLTVVLTQTGCNGRNYMENLEYMQAHTGGVGAGISLNLQATDFHQINPTFHIRGKALHRKASKLFPLLEDTVMSSDLKDLDRFKEILFKHYSGMESRLNQSALKYAINLASSPLSLACKVSNDLYGLPYFWKIRELVQNFDQEGTKVIEKLEEIQNKVLGLDHPHLILGCDNKTYDELKGHGFYGLKDLATSPFIPWKGNYPISPLQPQGYIIASPVAFIGQAFATISYVDKDSPALNLAAFLFDNITLHSRIREQGGAYGGGAVSNALGGNFYFYSYRDPNISKTLKAFNEAVDKIINGDFDETDLEEAKLEMVQALDSPISPGSRAELAYGWWKEGRTLELRQAYRHKMLSLTKSEIIEAVRTHIKPRLANATPIVFAGKGLLEEENQVLKEQGRPVLDLMNI